MGFFKLIEDMAGLPGSEFDFAKDVVHAEREVLPRLSTLPSAPAMAICNAVRADRRSTASWPNTPFDIKTL